MSALLVAKCVFVIVLFVGILTPLASWIERRQGALMQDRVGANRAGVAGITALGLLQPWSDLIKLLTKENVVPVGANRLAHGLAPLIALVSSIAMFAVIPYGGVYLLGSTPLSLVAADIDWGLLYIFALAGLATLGPVLAGWTSSSSASLLGAVRSAAQAVSCGVAMGLAIVGIFMVFGTLKLTDMATVQDSTLRMAGFLQVFEVAVPEWARRFPFTLPNWGIVLQPVGFVLFLPCLMAASGQPPFDLARADEELAGGYASEYSGMRLGLFGIAERVQVVAIAGVIVSLFLGGWSVPWLPTGTIIGAISPLFGEAFANFLCMLVHVASFLAKLVAMIWLQMLIRWSLPRFRYDQLMSLCWKVIVPLSVANIFATAVVLLLLRESV